MRTLIDFWSVPHFLSGVVASLFAIVFSVPLQLMFFAVLALAILWELLEMRFQLREASWNVASDIALPLISFPLTVMFILRAVPDEEHRAGLFLLALVLYIYTNAIAWQARLEHDSDFLS